MRIANLTVAVATLDRPEDLACCLQAVLSGDVLPGELIVVDQGINQSGRPVVEALQGQPFALVYMHQQRRGLSASRNAAIERASRPLIAFTDDDCAPGPGWVEAIERTFAESPEIGAVCGSVLPMGPETPGLHAVSPRESSVRADFRGKRIPWQVGTGGNFAIRRAWLERVGKFDERLGAGAPGKAAEDADLIYRLLVGGACIRYEPGAVIYHKRQSKERRLSSRWSYGYGIGAFCGLWLRKLDRYIFSILFFWFASLTRELGGALLKRQWMEARQRLLSLSGTLRGLIFGLWKGPAT